MQMEPSTEGLWVVLIPTGLCIDYYRSILKNMIQQIAIAYSHIVRVYEGDATISIPIWGWLPKIEFPRDLWG
jgi:hypothetical protein